MRRYYALDIGCFTETMEYRLVHVEQTTDAKLWVGHVRRYYVRATDELDAYRMGVEAAKEMTERRSFAHG